MVAFIVLRGYVAELRGEAQRTKQSWDLILKEMLTEFFELMLAEQSLFIALARMQSNQINLVKPLCSDLILPIYEVLILIEKV